MPCGPKNVPPSRSARRSSSWTSSRRWTVPVGLTFKDGSRISIGPNSRVQFTQFEFSPAEGKLAFLIDFFRGTMHYISGVIAKLSPDAVKVRTPVATVAVRGTRFLAKVEGD